VEFMLGDEHPPTLLGQLLEWDEAVGLDLRYVENWSLALDALIIGEDAVVIVKRSGAY
jgi:lipopolysaccharide/colanic/teichoic acid biosynthesis glycosyltransferase